MAETAQAMNNVGFSFAAQACTYWVGEAMGSVDHRDLQTRPGTTKTAATGAAHLARLLREAPYPKS